ncbi:MAG: DUF4912 domain-containing protein [Treponema sp.]|nr:DUF4912 domain-containing protein [Candidatus Treponema equi]
MKKNTLSRQQLEAMTTADLIALADEYGIDIPDNLNRTFIIGEVLEAAEEFKVTVKKTSVQITEEDTPVPDQLPKSYNNTYIDAIIRNPAWIFAFWDIKESDVAAIKFRRDFESIFLHISFYDAPNNEEPSDSIDIKTDFETNEQYILLPSGKKYAKVDLAVTYRGKLPEVLCSSRMIELPSEREDIQNLQPGKKTNYPQLVELSGMKQILHDHYLNHRQSFSE